MNIESLRITPEILSLISEIDEFKGAWRALGQLGPEQLSSLKKVATIESIGSSTRIEGSKLSDKEVEILLSNLEIQKFETRDEQEVAGYSSVMNLIFQSYADIPLSENYIRQLHSVLLQHTEKDYWHRGNYKKSPNHVEAFDAQGKSLGVVFETASPFETPIRMHNLVEWAGQAYADKKLHPLLITAIVVVEFLAIHPFQDGNWIFHSKVYHLFHSIVYQRFTPKFTTRSHGQVSYFSPKFTTCGYISTDITAQSLPLEGIC